MAACEPQEGPRLTPTIANHFIQDPTKVLGHDTTEYGLSVFTMQFAAVRPRDLDVFKTVLMSADRRQRAAIGLGLARATIFCRLADSAVSERIQKWVVGLPMHDVVTAYQQALSLSDDTDTYQPVGMDAPKLEDRFGAGLDLMPKPGPTGVGNLEIPDPTRLPGD
ncbi:hypothetical protein ACMDCR_25410 [Labrys okinawensis]|uniref:hypothetical protein n=1 Tax=Labrys okinawensis TaxID=346911 RepID=UPI0039BD85AD